MQKSGQQTTNRGMVGKSFSMTNYKKFQNVERLASLVEEIHNNKGDPTHKTQVSEKVLNLIKNRIKSSYDTMYEGYDSNKNQILKQIQQVERNDDTQSVMNNKVNQIIKDKSQYDKIKLHFQKNQKELRKLNDLRQKLKLNGLQNKQLIETVKDRYNLLALMDQHRINLDYETAVLQNMKKDRRVVKLHLKEKYEIMLKQNNNKNQRIKTIQDVNHTKKLLLKRIQVQLKKQSQFQIPLPLAEKLQKKLGQFQGKHNYQNLIQHEMQIQKKKQHEQAQMLLQQKNLIRKMKQQKQLQQKRQYEVIQGHCQLKRSEQQKIKRLCNLKDIKELSEDPLQFDFENLQSIKSQIEHQIENLRRQKEGLQQQISMYLTLQKQSSMVQDNKDNLLQVEEELEREETQLRRLNIHYDKKKQNLDKWLSISQFIVGGELSAENISQKLNSIIPRLQKLTVKEKIGETGPNVKDIYATANKQKHGILNIQSNQRRRTESQFNDQEIE